MAFLLNSRSVVMCRHGGTMSHTPGSLRSYTVEGAPVMLLSDHYQILGCTYRWDPCVGVNWVSPSNMLFVAGSPALINTSVGLTMTVAGIPLAPVLIVSFQTSVQEPETFTVVD